MMIVMRSRSFSLYVAATRAQVWQALTEPAQTRRFYFGLDVDSDWRLDEPIAYRVPGGPEWAGLHGDIVVLEPQRTLMHGIDESSWVTWQIDDAEPGVCRVALTLDTLDPDDDAEETDEAWSRMMSGLKTVLETGRALRH